MSEKTFEDLLPKEEQILDKHNYYLNIAEAVSCKSTCLRRNYGAVIVNNDEIISTGYNGTPRGVENCNTRGSCIRTELNIPRGTNYNLCGSVHSEQNAIISASRRDMIGGTLYLCGKDNSTGEYVENGNCCCICKRMIINAGIKQVVIRDTINKYRIIDVKDWTTDIESLIGLHGY